MDASALDYFRIVADQAAQTSADAYGLGSKYGISGAQFSALYSSLINRESSWRMVPNAGGSGAMGFSQLMPGTASEMGVDANDPVDNLRGGARYLAKLVDKYNGSIDSALQHYGGFSSLDSAQGYIGDIKSGAGIEGAPGSQPAESAGFVDTVRRLSRNFSFAGVVVLLLAFVLITGGAWRAVTAGK